MNANIIIHRPTLTEEERAYRIEQIKRATINFYKEVLNNESKKKTEEKFNHN